MIDAAKCKGCTMCARKCPAGAITGGLTSILPESMPLATSRDFMNSEMTTIFLKRAMMRLRLPWAKTRASAGLQLRHAGAQKMHGHTPPGRVQLWPSGV